VDKIGYMGCVEKIAHWLKADEGQKEKEDEYIASASKHVILEYTSNSESESNADDISMPDMMEESPPKRPRARQNIATPFLADTLDRTQVSDRKAAIVLTETARSLGYNPLTLAINRNTISRSRKTARAKLSKTFGMNFMQKKLLQFIGIRDVKTVE